MTIFSKKYEPETFEKEIYKEWELNGCFIPKDSTT
jgi:hypothetical protein